jgi:hypothetical protein
MTIHGHRWRFYSSRSSARRAARIACRQIFGPQYQPYEGPDFYIHPQTKNFDDFWSFELSPVVLEAKREKEGAR